MSDANTDDGRVEGTPDVGDAGANSDGSSSGAGGDGNQNDAVSQEVESLKKQVADLERIRSDAQSEKDRAIAQSEQLNKVVTQLVESQKAQATGQQTQAQVAAEQARLKELAGKVLEDSDPDALLNLMQNYVKMSDAEVESLTAKQKRERDAALESVQKEISELRAAQQAAHPDYLAHKDTVDALMAKGVDQATALSIVKDVIKPEPAQPARPDIPGNTDTSVVGTPSEGNKLTAAQIAQINEYQEGGPLTPAEIAALEKKGSK